MALYKFRIIIIIIIIIIMSMCQIISLSVLWCLNLLGTLDIKFISCTFVITVGMEYNVCFCAQFGNQFVHFVGAHVSVVAYALTAFESCWHI